MTDDLIAAARGEMKHPQQPMTLLKLMADALEAKDKRIAELEEDLRMSKLCASYEGDVAAEVIEENEKLRARIAELEAALIEALDYIDDPYDELAIQIGKLLNRAALEK